MRIAFQDSIVVRSLKTGLSPVFPLPDESVLSHEKEGWFFERTHFKKGEENSRFSFSSRKVNGANGMLADASRGFKKISTFHVILFSNTGYKDRYL